MDINILILKELLNCENFELIETNHFYKFLEHFLNKPCLEFEDNIEKFLNNILNIVIDEYKIFINIPKLNNYYLKHNFSDIILILLLYINKLDKEILIIDKLEFLNKNNNKIINFYFIIWDSIINSLNSSLSLKLKNKEFFKIINDYEKQINYLEDKLKNNKNNYRNLKEKQSKTLINLDSKNTYINKLEKEYNKEFNTNDKRRRKIYNLENTIDDIKSNKIIKLDIEGKEQEKIKKINDNLKKELELNNTKISNLNTIIENLKNENLKLKYDIENFETNNKEFLKLKNNLLLEKEKNDLLGVIKNKNIDLEEKLKTIKFKYENLKIELKDNIESSQTLKIELENIQRNSIKDDEFENRRKMTPIVFNQFLKDDNLEESMILTNRSRTNSFNILQLDNIKSEYSLYKTKTENLKKVLLKKMENLKMENQNLKEEILNLDKKLILQAQNKIDNKNNNNSNIINNSIFNKEIIGKMEKYEKEITKIKKMNFILNQDIEDLKFKNNQDLSIFYSLACNLIK